MCSTSDDCSLLGACRAGVCACRPPWVGAHCERIAFQPARPSGLNLLASNTSTWGGDTLFGSDGLWHMVYSEFEHHCGVNAWLQNSVVKHATAPTFAGPYTPKNRVFGLYSHEPTLAHDPIRNVSVMFFLHSAVAPTICATCTCVDGNSTSDCPPDWDANGRNESVPLLTHMSWTRDFRQWSAPVAIPQLDPYSDTAFQGTFLPNGTLVATTRWQMIVASNWNDTSTYREVARFKANAYGEGAHLWHNAPTDTFHLISHNGDIRGTTCGKHWFSRDLVRWQSFGCAYEAKGVAFEGGRTVDFGRRERPHPIHDAAGTLVALSTAVTAMPTTCVGRPRCLYRWPDASYTLVQSTVHTQ
jgi:hypothetical protein